jgi:hypothetical protein
MGRPPVLFDRAGLKHRKATLERIGGLWPHEIVDTSIGGRMRVLTVLKDQERTQRRIENQSPEHHSIEFHKLILQAIADEQAAIASIQRRLPIGIPAMQLRLIKD